MLSCLREAQASAASHQSITRPDVELRTSHELEGVPRRTRGLGLRPHGVQDLAEHLEGGVGVERLRSVRRACLVLAGALLRGVRHGRIHERLDGSERISWALRALSVGVKAPRLGYQSCRQEERVCQPTTLGGRYM